MDFDWIKEHRKALFNAAMVVAALGILAARFFSGGSAIPTQGDDAYESWIKDPKADEESLKVLTKAKLSSDLYAQVAARLIFQNEGQKAEPFAKNSLNHLRKALPEYAEFAEGGLLIASGKTKDALRHSLKLKEELRKEGKDQSLLYGYTLVRLASLAKELKSGEAESHEELEKFLASGSKPAEQLFVMLFKVSG